MCRLNRNDHLCLTLAQEQYRETSIERKRVAHKYLIESSILKYRIYATWNIRIWCFAIFLIIIFHFHILLLLGCKYRIFWNLSYSVNNQIFSTQTLAWVGTLYNLDSQKRNKLPINTFASNCNIKRLLVTHVWYKLKNLSYKLKKIHVLEI